MNETTQRTHGPLTGTVLSGRYRLDAKLGSGGMSTVYLARDETLERWIAVKVLHREISEEPDQLERFSREARAVAQLSHPNVVAVIDAGQDDGRPYIVFEYVEGETLKDRIERLGMLPLDEAAAYAIEIGRGLAAAHGRRLVHRDVKPQNVLIDLDGRAKVTDFGIARSLESDGLTRTGRVLGTTDYVSPEQAMGHDVDARSDIYSLGVVLFEMITGELPFKADTLVGVAMKHVNEGMPDIQRRRPETSAALAAVLERATAKDPARRYPNMAGMLRDLEEALEVEIARAGTAHGEATTVIDSVPPRRRRLRGARAPIAGILLVAAATVAAVLAVSLTGGGNGEPELPRAAPGAEIALSGASDFDPPPGDGREHPDRVDFAIDGDPETSWTTETYTAPVIADAISGKEGVGLIVETAEPVEPSAIEITSLEPGWRATIHGAPDGPPEDIGGWGEPIGGPVEMETEQSVGLDPPQPYRFFLIWITELAAANGNVVEISDVELRE